MTTRPTPPHRDIPKPIDRRFRTTQLTKLGVWLVFDGDTAPFAQIHLNERGSRNRSPRLIEACALLMLSGETFDFVEVVARMQPTTVDDPLTILITRAREIVAKKEGFSL
jgi:hypothetical protein